MPSVKADEIDEVKGGFKFKYVFVLAAFLLFTLSLLSHDALDLSIMDGGNDEPIRNWIGPVGAWISQTLLYLFGLATYPIALLMIICVARNFMPFKLYRRGYSGALLAVVLGITILMAMWPQDFVQYTDKLGIGRKDAPELALSGGVIGSQLAAPETKFLPAGIIRRAIGTVGTVILACCLLLPGIVFIIIADWRSVLAYMLETPAKVAAEMASEALEAAKRKMDGVSGKEQDAGPPPAPPRGIVYEDEDGESRKITDKVDEESKPSKTKAVEEVKIVRPGDEDEEQPLDESDPDDDYVPPPPLHGARQVQPAAPMRGAEPLRSAKPLATKREDDEETAPRATNDKAAAHDDPESKLAAALAPVHITNAMHGVDAPASPRSKSEPRKEMQTKDGSDYVLPPVSLLEKAKETQNEDRAHIEESQGILQSTLESFGVDGRVRGIVVGPRVTRFEVALESGVKVSSIKSIEDNIAMNLKAESIRILAPIPGEDAVGVEVPNKVSTNVFLRQIMDSPSWKESRPDIPICLGRDVGGKAVIADLAKAPHLLIAGSTGSGKSVCMNTLIMSLLFKFSPHDLRLILVDPKHVELEMYRPLPHLITPVVNDPKKVPLALRWGVNEMERRYKILARAKARNLNGFNSRPADPEQLYDEDGEAVPKRLPYLVIIIDELADIMMTDAKSDVETSICRIAQKGRAAGIHLVIATQTPRKDVVTGIIKANLPTKIAFKVTSQIDSRVILDVNGAESLLGKGDMLFRPPGGDALERVQGAWVSDPDIQKVVDFVSGQVEQSFDQKVLSEESAEGEGGQDDEGDDGVDEAPSSEFANSIAAKYLESGDGELVRKAVEIIITENKASTSYLQRRLGIGYNKSAEIMDLLERRGIVSAPLPGGQKREILVADHLETNEG